MKILVLNCGSSSLKFQLIESDRTLAKGLIEDLGGAAVLHFETEGKKPLREAIGKYDAKSAVEKALAVMSEGDASILAHREEIGAVGHRVVHGGEKFKASVLIDEKVEDGIEDNIALAPLHALLHQLQDGHAVVAVQRPLHQAIRELIGG